MGNRGGGNVHSGAGSRNLKSSGDFMVTLYMPHSFPSTHTCLLTSVSELLPPLFTSLLFEICPALAVLAHCVPIGLNGLYTTLYLIGVDLGPLGGEGRCGSDLLLSHW